MSVMCGNVGAKAVAPTSLQMSYKSCSYPPSNSKPAPYKPNALSWTAKGLGSATKGVDVSMWQHPSNQQIIFTNLSSPSMYGASFAFIKSSDGGNRDGGVSATWFQSDRQAAKAAGLIVGGYHYAVPGQSGKGTMIVPARKKKAKNYKKLLNVAAQYRHNDAVLQARQAYKNAMNTPLGDLPLTLDFEERPCGWTWGQVTTWTRDFLIEAQRISGRKPIIYANGYFVNKLNAFPAKDPKKPSQNFDFSVYPLWLASWSKTVATAPSSVPIWGTKWTFWQFTSDGALKDSPTAPTVPTSHTDLDVFNGTPEQLAAFAAKVTS